MMLCAVAAALAARQASPAQMPPNSWLEIPNTQRKTVSPREGQFSGIWGNCGPWSVEAAWGGGALDTKRNRLVLWGGGHGDYYGNELYAFDINRMAWERLTDPTPNPTLNQDVNQDGTPNSRHTYGGLAFIAHADRFFALGGSVAGNGGGACRNTWTFDFVAKKWTNRNPAGTLPRPTFGCSSSYDPASRKVWWAEESGLYSYDHDANSWTKHNSDSFYEFTGAIDTRRGLFVLVGFGKIFSYDIRGGSFARQSWKTTGGDEFLAHGKPGFDYDPVADKLVGWAGGAVYALDPDTKVWTARSGDGAPKPTQNGIYGRWRYVKALNAFILATDWSVNVHFFKLSKGVGKPASDGGKKSGPSPVSFEPTDRPKK